MYINKSIAKGSVVAPPSKSIAHRYLICAAMAEGKSVITNVDFSEDIKATIGCLKSLGAEITVGEHSVEILKPADFSKDIPRELFCNESGSTLRFFIGLSFLCKSKITFKGSEVLLKRPLSVYEKICQENDIELIRQSDSVSVFAKQPLKAGNFNVAGNISSQFITGLLFALPLLDGDSKIIISEPVESKSYINMTLQALAAYGVNVYWQPAPQPGEQVLVIPGNQKYTACSLEIEGDYSNAAFFEALNAIGGEVTIKGLNPESLQGDKVYGEYFAALRKGYAKLDISDCPDLGPILMTVAAANHGALFTGTKRLEIKESNRGVVMCQELAKFGVKTNFSTDEIEIISGELKMPEEVIDGHNDHRIVMSMATLLTLTGGKIEGTNAVRKSFPDYFERIQTLGISIEQ